MVPGSGGRGQSLHGEIFGDALTLRLVKNIEVSKIRDLETIPTQVLR